MTLYQYDPPHPGLLIKSTYVEPFKRKISGNEIAKELGVQGSTLSRLMSGKSDVTPEMAVKLSVVLGGTAQSWLSLQISYDLWKAKQVVDVVELRSIDFNKVA